jgi:hypothetical protein
MYMIQVKPKKYSNKKNWTFGFSKAVSPETSV